MFKGIYWKFKNWLTVGSFSTNKGSLINKAYRKTVKKKSGVLSNYLIIVGEDGLSRIHLTSKLKKAELLALHPQAKNIGYHDISILYDKPAHVQTEGAVTGPVLKQSQYTIINPAYLTCPKYSKKGEKTWKVTYSYE